MKSNSYFSRLIGKAETRGQDTFYTFVDEAHTTSTTYAAFYGRVQAAAAFLAACGVGRGSTVLIFGQHGPAVLHAFYGAQLLGAIPAFMPPPTARQDPASWRSSHAALIERIAPALILADPDAIGPLSEIAPALTRALGDVDAADDVAPDAYRSHDADPASVAFLQHSSGTTGLKKGVVVTYEQLENQLGAYASELGLGDDAAVVSWLPIYHDMGLIAGTLLPLVRGLPVHWIHTFAWLARPQLFIDGLAATSGAVAWLPNFAFPYMARRCEAPGEGTLAGVKAIINCSEPCKAADMEAFRKRFEPAGLPPTALQVSYAMAENVFAVTQTRLDRPVRTLAVSKESLLLEHRAKQAEPGADGATTFVSCGVPIAGTRFRIGGAERDGDVGEIEVAGDSLCSGYFRNTELTAERFVDGWYRTGDYGFVDDGELFVTGRRDDLIIVRGRNLYAHDIEAIVTRTGTTRAGRCVAIGVNDERSGTQQLVVLAETGDPNPDAVPLILEAVFSEFGVSPSDVLLVGPDVLVKTTSGKISRSENLQRYLSGQLQSWATRDG